MITYELLRQAAELLRKHPDRFSNTYADQKCSHCEKMIKAPELYFIMAGKFYHPNCWANRYEYEQI